MNILGKRLCVKGICHKILGLFGDLLSEHSAILGVALGCFQRFAGARRAVFKPIRHTVTPGRYS